MRRKFLYTFLAVLLAAFMFGCSGVSSLKKGWVETSGLRHANVRYHYFNGVEQMSFRASEGDDIQLDFEVQVEEGSLRIKLEGPDGNEVWSKSYQEDAEGSASMIAPEKGRYHLRVAGEETEGGYEISWDVEG
jgi:methionine-rich copper-binding protein CopC